MFLQPQDRILSIRAPVWQSANEQQGNQEYAQQRALRAAFSSSRCFDGLELLRPQRRMARLGSKGRGRLKLASGNYQTTHPNNWKNANDGTAGCQEIKSGRDPAGGILNYSDQSTSNRPRLAGQSERPSVRTLEAGQSVQRGRPQF